MIKYEYKKVKTIVELTVSGHANYKKHGQDIVCASVSTALILSANLIERMGYIKHIELEVNDGYFYLKVHQSSEVVEQVLINLVETLIELEQQYPKYIKNQKEG
ncbi:MAG TPA: ribosomal-processing cysteine protease Prp [Acholeplasmataceae bacterium]|nr:ribosomal-processing cysteine protease Prp [Acholeplasmataceae bacterium]